jgi:hypothetical protein
MMSNEQWDIVMEMLRTTLRLELENHKLRAELAERKGGRKTNSAARDLALLIHVIRLKDKGHSTKRACDLVAQKHPDFGYKPESLRLRFLGLTNPNDKRYAAARERMFALLATF